ncbi:MAG: SnoaL-like domain-containing protein [Myxococcota bacterium]
MAARKKTTKKVARKKASPTRAPRKKAAPRRRTAASRKTAASAQQKASPAELLARKIVRFANQPEKLDLEEIYAADCVSREPQGPAVSGIEGVRGKGEQWASMVESQNWTARTTFVKGNRICIEWHAELRLRDGRELELEEVAVHEVKGGKIVAERYYYDPSVLAAPAQPEPASDDDATRVLPVAQPQEAAELAEPPPPELPEDSVPQGTPPLDPLDL